MNTIPRSVGAVTMARVADVLVVRTGRVCLTLEYAFRLQAITAEEVARLAPSKVLVDLREAVVMFAPERADALVDESATHSPVVTGILVDPVNEALCWRYCTEMLARGHTRLAFTKFSSALRWLGLPEGAWPETRPFAPAS